MPRLHSTARVVAVVSLLALVQVTFISQMQIARVAPDTLLLLAVASGVVAGPDRGALVGFAAGLAYDLFLQTPLGLSALVYCVVAYLVGLFQLPLASQPRLWRAGSVLVASALGVILWTVTGLMLGQEQLLGVSLPRVVVVVALVNGALSLPALRVAAWLYAPLAAAERPLGRIG